MAVCYLAEEERKRVSCLLILIVLWLSVVLLRKRELLACFNYVVAVCYLAEELRKRVRAAYLF